MVTQPQYLGALQVAALVLAMLQMTRKDGKDTGEEVVQEGNGEWPGSGGDVRQLGEGWTGEVA